MDLKFDYTENNHFKWGFGDDGWYNDADRSGKFRLHLGYCTRPVESFREECIHAARLIGQKATKPIVVGLSGGSDSQMACLSFREAGIPFSVVIARLRNNNNDIINQHDIATAYKFCETYNISYHNFDLNLDYYYRTIGREYASYYGFTGQQTIVQCAVMDYIGSKHCYIMAGGDPMMTLYHPVLTPGQDMSNMTPVAGNFYGPVWWQTPQPVMRHMMEMGYEGTSKFYLYTPELIASFLTDPICKYFYASQTTMYESFMVWQKKNFWTLFHMMFKPLLTNKHWPEIIQNRKLTGFEEIDKEPDLQRYYQYLLRDAADGKGSGCVIPILMSDLIEYITTPHTHALESIPLADPAPIQLTQEFKDRLDDEQHLINR
jgi:hypothetical protein